MQGRSSASYDVVASRHCAPRALGKLRGYLGVLGRNSNRGHEHGASRSDGDRWAVVAYLKTL